MLHVFVRNLLFVGEKLFFDYFLAESGFSGGFV